ncbi:MAG: thioredoxin domain-containing protein [Candidatus Nanoarchaeia archaeon]
MAKQTNYSLENISDEKAFEELVLKPQLPVVVNFYAPWAISAIALNKLLEKVIIPKYGRETKFYKIDVEIAGLNEVVRDLEIKSLPALYIFKKGNVIGKTSLLTQELVEEFLNRCL